MSSSSKNRRRAATANDAELNSNKRRVTTVDYLNAFGGVEDEAEEAEDLSDRYRAKSVDFIREKAAKEKKRSNSLDLVVDDLIKTFLKGGETTTGGGEGHRQKSRNLSRTSVDILNAFGGIAEEDEEEEDS
jgi:hypothetical protein